MTLQELETLEPGYLIYVEWSTLAGMPKREWFVGIPSYKETEWAGWVCKVLSESRLIPAPLDYILQDSDIITPIPPQDLVKYIACLTDAGAEYLKELKL